MEVFERKKHWENIYQTKELTEVSWYQPKPETSLNFIQKHKLNKDAKIIDVGGGDSYLVDHLLGLGYTDISVLDISPAAIERAKLRLGARAESVNWIVADAAQFKPDSTYDLWHDRAAFHFLVDEKEVAAYAKTASEHITTNGILIMGTFSVEGPKKCSGIDIQQYTENSLTEVFYPSFKKESCEILNHPTPFGTLQNFVFCTFRRK